LFNRLYQKLVNLPLRFLVSSKLLPENPSKELDIDLEQPIYYVIQRRSTSSFLMLKAVAKRLGWPEPKIISEKDETIANGAVFFLQNKNFFGLGGGPIPKYQRALLKLLEKQKAQPQVRHQLVPVSIYWGRNPGKENSLLRLFFTDTENATPLRKLLLFIFQGRNTFVRIAQPVDLPQLTQKSTHLETTRSKLTRLLRVYFHRQRLAAMGPLISNRKQVITNLLASDKVRAAIEREAKSKNISKAKAKKLAEKYAKEIASSYSYKTFRFLESILTHLWNRIYDGVVVKNTETIRRYAASHELIYVPCHRSHIDYLLLSYMLYHEGLVPPHIAAGINLNFWPVGGILRRGGAFFIRRSFGGNKLYTAVFNEYIYQLMNRGIPIEFFPEGGRSRTGRLLPPKTGMLAMIVQSFLRGTRKPVAIVPVYIGYERMMEGKSYINELRGAQKQKESFGQLLRARKTLKEEFGKVFLNFGTPMDLGDYLQSRQLDWQAYRNQHSPKPNWLTQEVALLADRLMQQINANVTVNAVSLVALNLLATDRFAMGKYELKSQLALLKALSKEAPFSESIYIPDDSPEALIEQAKKLGTIQLIDNPMGDIVSTDEYTAILLTYYRNNIIHLYVLPALIASFFINHDKVSEQRLKKEIQALFPLLKSELYIYWDEATLLKQIDANLQVLVSRGLLAKEKSSYVLTEQNQHNFNQLYNLAQLAAPLLLRYGIILTLLSTSKDKGNIDRRTLETRSQQIAQRIAVLYSLNAPEAFDSKLFRNCISTLKDMTLIEVDENNQFEVSSQLIELKMSVLDKMTTSAKQMMQKTASWAENYWSNESGEA